MFWPFTVFINCSSDLNILANFGLQPRISKKFSKTRAIFLTVGQNNFGSKTPMFQKLFWTFTFWINCSSDLKNFENSRTSISNFKKISQSLEQFFLTVGQNNFGTNIPLPNYRCCGRKIPCIFWAFAFPLVCLVSGTIFR